VLLKSVTGI